ncbi:hypothetical protein Ancab_018055 [Ancistrocladus abbreviatus]
MAAAFSSGKGLNPTAPEFHPRTSSLSPHSRSSPPASLPYSSTTTTSHFPSPTARFSSQPPTTTFLTLTLISTQTTTLVLPPTPTTHSFLNYIYMFQYHHHPSPPPPPPLHSLSLISSHSFSPPTTTAHTTAGIPPLPSPLPPTSPKLPEQIAEENPRTQVYSSRSTSNTPPRQGQARDFVDKWLCKGGFEHKRTSKNSNNHEMISRQGKSRSKGGHDQYCDGSGTSYSSRSSSSCKHKKIGSRFPNYSYLMMKKKNQNKEKVPPIPVSKDGSQTTVMIRNIPNQYSREELAQFLDDFCRRENENNQIDEVEKEISQSSAAFDFLYLPIDFRTLANRGFAFVNFTDPKTVWKLHLYNSSNQIWEKYSSDKRREIAYAKIQGKEALVEHFEKSVFTCGSDDFLPVCFSPPRDGSGSEVAARMIGQRVDWRDLFISREASI